MKEQIVFNLDPQYIKVVAADREREAQNMRLVRQTKRARSEKGKTQGGRRRLISLRDPLKAYASLAGGSK
jgi:hypothetical protein